MKVISWNIQAAKGVDEVTDVERIVRITKAMGDADVICFQEVMDCVVDGKTISQSQALAQHFPQYQPFFGTAIDRLQSNGRLQFGNLMLSRLPVLQHSAHRLPQPAHPGSLCMPRQATEALVQTTTGICRIVTTHLEYFATLQRSAQVAYLRDWHAQTLDRFRQPGATGGELQFKSLPETEWSIYCGDFNMGVDSADYQILTEAEPGDTALQDCWPLAHRDKPHAPTCGIFDHQQWPEGAHCRDFFFASGAIADRVSGLAVNVDTNASDHQPLMLTVNTD